MYIIRCFLEITLFLNFRAKCAKHHPGYCKYLVLCGCKHLQQQQQQKQKKLSQLLIFPDHLSECNSPYILTIVDDAPRSDATQKKIFFFKMHIKKLVMSDTKKKTSCILSFSPTQCRHKMFSNFKNQWSPKDLVLNISPLALVYLYGMTWSFFSDYSTWVGSGCESGTKILVWTGRKTDPVFGFFLKKFNR